MEFFASKRSLKPTQNISNFTNCVDSQELVLTTGHKVHSSEGTVSLNVGSADLQVHRADVARGHAPDRAVLPRGRGPACLLHVPLPQRRGAGARYDAAVSSGTRAADVRMKAALCVVMGSRNSDFVLRICGTVLFLD